MIWGHSPDARAGSISAAEPPQRHSARLSLVPGIEDHCMEFTEYVVYRQSRVYCHLQSLRWK